MWQFLARFTSIVSLQRNQPLWITWEICSVDKVPRRTSFLPSIPSHNIRSIRVHLHNLTSTASQRLLPRPHYDDKPTINPPSTHQLLHIRDCLHTTRPQRVISIPDIGTTPQNRQWFFSYHLVPMRYRRIKQNEESAGTDELLVRLPNSDRTGKDRHQQVCWFVLGLFFLAVFCPIQSQRAKFYSQTHPTHIIPRMSFPCSSHVMRRLSTRKNDGSNQT